MMGLPPAYRQGPEGDRPETEHLLAPPFSNHEVSGYACLQTKGGLLGTIPRDSQIASRETGRAVGPFVVATVGPEDLLFRDRGYVQPVAAAPIRSPAFRDRGVSRPEAAEPCSSPPAGRVPSTARASSRPPIRSSAI